MQAPIIIIAIYDHYTWPKCINDLDILIVTLYEDKVQYLSISSIVEYWICNNHPLYLPPPQLVVDVMVLLATHSKTRGSFVYIFIRSQLLCQLARQTTAENICFDPKLKIITKMCSNMVILFCFLLNLQMLLILNNYFFKEFSFQETDIILPFFTVESWILKLM